MSSESGDVEQDGGASAEVLIEISADGGEANTEAEVQSISTDGAAAAADEVRIDISSDGSDTEADTEGGGGTSRQGGAGRRERRGRSRSSRRASAIVETTVALGGQAIGAVVAAALTGRASWFPVYVVELCIVMGLSLIFVALSLRRHRPGLSTVAAKIGAVGTAAAVVVAVASHLPVALAWVVGAVTFMVVCVAVVFM